MDKASPGKHRKPFICSLCGMQSMGWNCNGWPLTEGNCCERCDKTRVIPARIALVYAEERAARKKPPGD